MCQTWVTVHPLIFLGERCVTPPPLCAAHNQETVPHGQGLRRPDPWQRGLHTGAADHVRSRAALRHGVGHHAQDLEHQIGHIERGVARGVEGGDTSQTSPPMSCNPRNPRSITWASRISPLPGSGAPVPMA